jgi:hypothetical protein
MMESFWARMQVELLNRRRWRTRLELANAIFEYLEIFHNRQRRHSSLGMLTRSSTSAVTHQHSRFKRADRAKPGAHEEPPTNPGRFTTAPGVAFGIERRTSGVIFRRP